jgi:hypothetical protein
MMVARAWQYRFRCNDRASIGRAHGGRVGVVFVGSGVRFGSNYHSPAEPRATELADEIAASEITISLQAATSVAYQSIENPVHAC